MSRVQGHGGELDRVETYRGTTVKMGLSDKVRFEIAVSDEFVEPTIDALCDGGRTGEVGDGKIFVLAARAGRPHPHRRDRQRGRDAGGRMMDSLSPSSRGREGRHGRHRLDAHRDRARAPDDAGARPLLRGPRAREEHAQHVHDVHRRARGRRRSRGRVGRLLARVRRHRRPHRRPRLRRPARRRRSSRATARRSRTWCSSPSRRPSASSRPRWSSGAVVERMRFGAFLIFAALWSVLVYAVLAHWAFGGGWLIEGGTLDFAGGVPVEMGSGFSALAAALVVGARKDYGRQALLPHNAVYVLLGAGLLWFGWFGFNGGSGFSTGDRRRARVREHAAHAGVHAARVVRARPDPRPEGDGDRRGDGDHRRLRRHHAGRRLRQPRVGDGARRPRRAAELRGDRRGARGPAWTRRSTCSPRTASRASRASCSSASSPRRRGTASPTASSTATPPSSATRRWPRSPLRCTRSGRRSCC